VSFEATQRAPTGPLAGLRVADFTRVLAGPYATMMLADFGADVIKIESPDGDETRQWTPPVDETGSSTYFASVNRNKRSTVCDLRAVDGVARAMQLAETADIVVENLRPGAMKQFGLDWDSLRAKNPRMVYCSISGFGPQAPGSMPGYDLLVQAVGGLMSITGPVDGPESKAGVALVDVVTGLNAVSGILLALRARDAALESDPSSNASQLVEVNLLSSLLSALTNQASSTLATGVSPRRTGNAHPSIAPYEVFTAADRPLVIAVGNDRQFRTLARLIDAEELATMAEFSSNPSRLVHRDELRRLLNDRLSTRSAEHWIDIFSDAGVPAGLINTISEAFDFARNVGLETVVPVGGGTGGLTVANPITIAGNPAEYNRAPPTLDQHPFATWSRHPVDSPSSETDPLTFTYSPQPGKP
jgi:crotonobetainyl-CoA:carnitine CoA-transferase CaiB-like acyl-CoA transferase